MTGDQAVTDVTEGSAGASTGQPLAYRLITPLEWYRIPLAEQATRDRSVQALVDRTCPNRDEDAARRRELSEFIGNLASKAAFDGGLELYLSQQAVLGVPVPASLVVQVEAPDHPGLHAPAAVIAEAQRLEHPDAEVGVVELSTGEAVRVRRRDAFEGDEDIQLPDGRASTIVTYIVPIPDSDAHLVLAFSTPLEELAEALVEVFDAVAGSLSWK